MKSISKLKDDARRHEQKEEWEKAIQVYLQVLQIGEEGEAEVELPLYNRVGDLAVRLGRPKDAVRYYEQAADRYADAGLYNNAIALCNKALRYGPDRLELLKKLGQFSASQGFITDARRYFLEYAEKQFASGEVDEALTALEDFANVSDDPEVRELLGRRLHAHGRTDEAVAELQRAYVARERAGDRDRAEALRAEILAIDPNALSADTASPAAPAFAAPSTHAQEPTELPGLSEIDAGAFEIGSPAPEGGTLDGLEGTALGSADDAIDFGTIELAGFESGAGVADTTPPPASTGGIEGLETTTLDFGTVSPDAVEDLGLEHDEASFDLPTLDEPEEDTAAEPLPTFGDADDLGSSFELPMLEDQDDAAGALPLLGEEEEEGDSAFELPTLDMDDSTFELPSLDEPEEEEASFELPMLGEPADTDSFELPTLEEPDDTDTFELPTLEESEEAPALPAFAESDTLEPPGFDTDEAELEPVEEGDSASPFELAAMEESAETSTLHAEIEAAFTVPDAGEDIDEFAFAEEDTIAPADEDLAALADEGVTAEAGDLESDVSTWADDTEEVDEPLDAGAVTAMGDDTADIEAVAIEDVAAEAERAEEARAEMVGGWTPEALGPAPPKAAAPASAQTPAAASGDEFIDLGALLAEDEEHGTRFRVQETAPTGDEDRDFAELLNQFKAKVSEHLPAEDAAAHYDLGLAFKEMGLVDEAISEFQVALRAGHMRLKVYEELGHCFLQKEQFNIAEKVLRRALDMKYDDELELLGVYYHLGRAYEAMGRRDQARDAYERVLGLDINFQDVTERLARL